ERRAPKETPTAGPQRRRHPRDADGDELITAIDGQIPTKKIYGSDEPETFRTRACDISSLSHAFHTGYDTLYGTPCAN
ncbi:unnamed protein product, partial [Tenebrio molitor]